MRHFEILNEFYLAGEFTIGFELEGYYKITDPVQTAIEDEYLRDHWYDKIKETLDSYFKSTGSKVVEDTSLTSTKLGLPFEYNSPVLKVNPENLIEISKLFKDLPELGIQTDKTCGLHIHIGLPRFSNTDRAWIIAKLAMSPDAQDLLTKLEDINFVNWENSPTEYLKSIKSAINQKYYSVLSDYLNMEKYNMLGIHPQGTLEWRGPRNFLNDGQTKYINLFLKNLYSIVRWMSKTLSEDKINELSKQEFFDQIGSLDLQKPKSQLAQSKWSSKQDTKLIPLILKKFPWLLKASFTGAEITIDDKGQLFWHNGTWLNGTWENGEWQHGLWKNGLWKNGYWVSGTWLDGTWENGDWSGGTFNGGVWQSGVWHNGTFNKGTWKGGRWENGHFTGGTWLNGKWFGGVWTGGEWKSSQPKPGSR